MPPQTPSISANATSDTQTTPRVVPGVDGINRIFTTILEAHRRACHKRHPIIVRDVPQSEWKMFRKRSKHRAFKGLQFEYDDSRFEIIAILPASPLHDIAVKVMSQHVYIGMLTAGFAPPNCIKSLLVSREKPVKRTSAGGLTKNVPDCALWSPSYNNAIPTIIWEIGHSQPRSSLIRLAKMWCRHYDGKIRVVILVKYLRKDPRVDNAAELMVYRPHLREDGKWTAVQDGRNYVLFPRPAGVVEGVVDDPDDAVPLTYEDYFGTARDGVGGSTRFDLPLERVRGIISVVLDAMVVDDVKVGRTVTVENDGSRRDSPVQIEEYEQFGEEWNAVISDVSDDP